MTGTPNRPPRRDRRIRWHVHNLAATLVNMAGETYMRHRHALRKEHAQ